MHSCLSRVPIFQALSQEEMNQVHEYLRPRRFKSGEYAQVAGQYSPRLLVLNRGSAKVSRSSPSGDEQIIRMLAPGDYIGEVSVFAGIAANYDVELLEDSSFCTLSKEHLHEMLKDYPDLSLKMLGDMSTRLEAAETKIESLALQDADERLFDVLIKYSEGEETFNLKPTKKTIAIEIGVRPETISRSLKSLQNKGLIEYSGKSITILKHN